MNDNLDLRNRILKMRENNNLTVNSKDALNNDLMTEFESSIKDDKKKGTNFHENNLIDQKKRRKPWGRQTCRH